LRPKFGENMNWTGTAIDGLGLDKVSRISPNSTMRIIKMLKDITTID